MKFDPIKLLKVTKSQGRLFRDPRRVAELNNGDFRLWRRRALRRFRYDLCAPRQRGVRVEIISPEGEVIERHRCLPSGEVYVFA